MSILERRKIKAADLKLAGPIAALAVTGLFSAVSRAGSISSGDLLVFQGGTSGTPNSNVASPLIIDDLSLTNNTSASLNQSWNLSSGAAGSDLLYTSNNGSNGELTVSNNGSIVTFGGYVGTASGGNEVNATQRDAVALTPAGTFTEPTNYSESALGQVRSAATLDGTNYVFGGKSGNFINGGSTPVNSTNVLEAADYGGVLYAASAASNISNAPAFFSVNPNGVTNAVYTFAASTANSVFANATDFVLLKSGNNGSTYDTLYVADGKVIEKFDVSGTTLTLVGTDTLTTQATDAITGVEVGNTTNPTVDLFLTSPGNTTAGAYVQEIVDTTSYSANIGTVAATTLYSTGVATKAVALYGISLAPTSHSAVTTFSSSPPGGYTEATGTSTPSAGGSDVNVANINSIGYLNKISGGTGVNKGFVTVSGISSTTPAIIALAIKISAYGNNVSLSSDGMALTDVIADLQAGATNTINSSTVTVEPFSALPASQQSAFSSGETTNGGATFDIAILTTGATDFSWDLSNESVDGITSINVTDVAVGVPEPTSAAVFVACGLGFLQCRRRQKRRSSAIELTAD